MSANNDLTQHEFEQEKFRKQIEFACSLLIAIDSIFNGSFIYKSMSIDGVEISDILTAFLVSIASFFLLRMVAIMGIRKIPTLKQETYSKVFPIWLTITVFSACASIYLTVSVLGLPLAQNEYLNQTIHKTNNVASSVIKSQRRAESLEATLLSSSNSASVLLNNEKKSGAVCSKGGGKGECANIISGILSVSASTRDQIIDSKSSASPLIRRIEELQDSMRRTAKDQDLSFADKADKTKELIDLMVLDTENLKQVIPIPALQSAIDAFSREFKSSGIGTIGASRLKAEFAPVAQRLTRELGELRAVSNRQINTIDNLSNYEILVQGINAIIPIFAIAFLLGLSPLGLGLCAIITGREPYHNEPRYRDNLTDINSKRKAGVNHEI